MTKETLTVETIKEEFRKEKKERTSLCVSAFIIVLVLVFLTVWMIKLSGLFIILTVFFGAWSLLFVLVVITLVQDVIKVQQVLNQEICVVKDRLIGMEEKVDIGGPGGALRPRKLYYLSFSGYGEFLVSTYGNYAWSTVLGPMSAEGVYRSSRCGDEFYLVLSQPHTGKILRAYNTNFFELKE